MSKRTIFLSLAILGIVFLAGAALQQTLAFQIGRTPPTFPPNPQSKVAAAPVVASGNSEYRILTGGVGQSGRFMEMENGINNLSNQGFEVVSFQLDTTGTLPGRTTLDASSSMGIIVLLRRTKP